MEERNIFRTIVIRSDFKIQNSKPMQLNKTEVEFLKRVFGMLFENYPIDSKEVFIAKSIEEKADMDLDFRLPSRISNENRRKCVDLMKEIDAVVSEYASYAGDMSLINEYDRMKKYVSAAQNRLGDMEGSVRAFSEMAAKELESAIMRIKEEILDGGDAKTNAEAERKAKIDPRLDGAVKDYKDLLELSYRLKNKYRAIDRLHDDLRQSISTARSSIIKEGYTT